MKSTHLTAMCLLFCATTQAANAEYNRHIDYARVTNVEPVYKTVEHRVPQKKCWIESVREEPQYRTQHDSPTGTLVGGVVGGVIGNAVGKGGDNKKIGAVVGSLIGMSIGHDISKRNRRHNNYHEVNYRDVERCDVRYTYETEQKLDDYNVTYKFNGQSYQTQMDYDPGDQIKVVVNVQPL